MKVKGRNIPKKNRKAAKTVRKYGSSVNGLTKSMIDHGLGVGGRRDFTVKLAYTNRPRIRKAAALIAHGNPRSAMSFSIMIGKTTCS